MTADASGVMLGEFQGPMRVLYRRWVEELDQKIDSVDLSRRENFHHAMFLLSCLGLNQAMFAGEHGFQPSTVNRWVNGQKAPPKMRRAPVVREALRALQARINAAANAQDNADTDLVILRSYPEPVDGVFSLLPTQIHV